LERMSVTGRKGASKISREEGLHSLREGILDICVR
jgi:hypothetical protein